MATPDEDICGFTLDSVDVVPGDVLGPCPLDPMAGSGRCVWHTPAEAKSAEELAEAWTDVPQNLQGAKLSGVALEPWRSFAGCSLDGADLTDADLSDVDFSGADLRLADLAGADLTGADLSNATLFRATLDGADLSGADLTGAHVVRADLPETTLADATLTDATLSMADLTDADLTDADLTDAELDGTTLEGASLSGATLFSTSLFESTLYGADLSGVQINRYTRFGGHYDVEEYGAYWFAFGYVSGATGLGLKLILLLAWPFFALRGLWRLLTPPYPTISRLLYGDVDDEREDLRKAAWSYRKVANLCRDHGFSRRARELTLRRKEIRRRLYLVDDPDHRSVLRWLFASVSSMTTKHGESYVRVVGFSVLVVLASAVLYPVTGGVTTDAPVPGSGPLHAWAGRLYFSVVTFTTLGYGDVQPATRAAQVLAAGEAFVGALLLALLVFVLGRRTTW